MEVFLIVLKIIGIALLSVIGLLLLIVLLLLFWPFFYRIEAAKSDTVSAKARVTWLLHIVVAEVLWQSGLNIRLKLFGIPIYDKKRKAEKAARKAEKEKNKKKNEPKPDEAVEDNSEAEEKNPDTTGDKDSETSQETAAQTSQETSAVNDKPADENASDAETDSGDEKGKESETNALTDAEDAGEAGGKKKKKSRKKRKSFDERIDDLEKLWDRFCDFLDRAPEKLAEWLDYLPDKAGELLDTIDYYDRLLNSEGTEWVIEYVKKHGLAMLFHVLPYRTDATLDYCDDDPGKVAKIYEYQAFALPVLDRIAGKRGRIDILAYQDDKKVECTFSTRGRLFLGFLAWHALCLLLNKKVKGFLKRLKREEA